MLNTTNQLKLFIFISFLFLNANNLFSNEEEEEYFVPFDVYYGYDNNGCLNATYSRQNRWADSVFGSGNHNHRLINFLTSSYFIRGFHDAPQLNLSFDYGFTLDDGIPKATFWFYTYYDSINNHNMFWIPFWKSNHYNFTTWLSNATGWMFGGFQNSHISLRFDKRKTFSNGITTSTEITTSRINEFAAKIKEDTELYENLQFVVGDTANQYFVFGAGFLEQMAFRPASYYDIDGDRPICFLAIYHRHENKWDFCYSYADEEITEMFCISNYNSISEPSTIANLLVSPNPTDANTTVSVDLETAGNLTVTLNNMLGQELFEIYNGFTVEGNFTKTFSTENLPTGIYFLQILLDGKYTVAKVVVE